MSNAVLTFLSGGFFALAIVYVIEAMQGRTEREMRIASVFAVTYGFLAVALAWHVR